MLLYIESDNEDNILKLYLLEQPEAIPNSNEQIPIKISLYLNVNPKLKLPNCYFKYFNSLYILIFRMHYKSLDLLPFVLQSKSYISKRLAQIKENSIDILIEEDDEVVNRSRKEEDSELKVPITQDEIKPMEVVEEKKQIEEEIPTDNEAQECYTIWKEGEKNFNEVFLKYSIILLLINE